MTTTRAAQQTGTGSQTRPATSRWDWAERTMIRPVPERDDAVELTNSLTTRRDLVDVRGLLGLLRDDRDDPPEPVIDELGDRGYVTAEADSSAAMSGLEHWRERGWEWALDYYLWSRGQGFVDASADAAASQRPVLDGYRSAAGLPTPAVPDPRDGLGLPEPAPLPDTALGKVLFRRRAGLKVRERPLPGSQLSAVLWHGLRRVRRHRLPELDRDPREALLSYGTAFDFHLLVFDVPGLAAGVYDYEPTTHRLRPVRLGGFRERARQLVVGQPAPDRAACTFVMSVDFPRCQWRYRHERALRDLYVEAGRVLQEVILVCTAFELTQNITPAVRDSEFVSFLGLQPVDSAVMYTLSVG